MSDAVSSIFRSAGVAPSAPAPAATPSAKPSAPQARITHTDDGPTPYVYQALKKQPYAVKFLDLDLYHDDADFPDVREQAAALDKYVIQKAKARGLEDSEASYKEVVDALFKQIGKSPNESPTQTLKRLATAAGAIERLEAAKIRPILSAETLTPEEYEETRPE